MNEFADEDETVNDEDTFDNEDSSNPDISISDLLADTHTFEDCIDDDNVFVLPKHQRCAANAFNLIDSNASNFCKFVHLHNTYASLCRIMFLCMIIYQLPI